jgi:2-phosphosulfolactate phosphatase
MIVHRKSMLDGAASARGCAVIVDVFRAYTCAALMLSGRPDELRLEEDVDLCLRLRREKGYMAVGEVNGVKVAGFDLGNTPSGIGEKGRGFFAGRQIVLRTSAGVRGAFAAKENCRSVWAVSYPTVGATARVLRNEDPAEVHIVAMGWGGEGRSPEDERCADCLHSMLEPAQNYDHASALAEILADESARKFLRGDSEHFPPEDVAWCLQRDLFDFAMRVEDSDGVLRLVRV